MQAEDLVDGGVEEGKGAEAGIGVGGEGGKEFGAEGGAVGGVVGQVGEDHGESTGGGVAVGTGVMALVWGVGRRGIVGEWGKRVVIYLPAPMMRRDSALRRVWPLASS